MITRSQTPISSGVRAAWGAGVEIAFRAPDVHAVAADDVVVRAQQEMHVLSGATQHRAVVTPDRAATDDRNFHRAQETASRRQIGNLKNVSDDGGGAKPATVGFYLAAEQEVVQLGGA
jgi:hypothetical protein